MERILDFSAPLDVELFDSVVSALSSSNPAQIMQAQEVLSKFEAADDAFATVYTILMQARQMQSKFIALQVLDKKILTKWNTIDAENQIAIRNFVMSLIVQECGSFAQVRQNRALLTKMNVTLVNIAKKEWPERWPNFVTDICTSAGPEDPMVENNIHILRLVGEEIFECGDRTLPSRWVERRKALLREEFRLIVEFLSSVISSDRVDTILLKSALVTLKTYVPWLPAPLIFTPALLSSLATMVVGHEHIRMEAVQCLAEICTVDTSRGADGDDQTRLVATAFQSTFGNIINALPPTHQSTIYRVVDLYEKGNSGDHAYLAALAVLTTNFLRKYTVPLAYNEVLLRCANELVVGLTNVEDDEIFKTCVEYWWWLGRMLTNDKRLPAAVKTLFTNRLAAVLSDTRFVLVRKMAKPPEITVKEEDGELRCEKLTDLEEIEMYRLMKETLYALSKVDPTDMSNILMNNLSHLVDFSEWSYQNCNSLAWSVGAISGSMNVSTENNLFVNVVKNLLLLCKTVTDKPSKAHVATDIMFVVAEYPRYMRANPRLFFTVVRKVLEFMRERVEGVKQMAVDTFERLCERLADVMVADVSGAGSLVETEIVPRMPEFMSDLDYRLVEQCYRAFGLIVAAEAPEKRKNLLGMFLTPVNTEFNRFTATIAALGTGFCHDGQNLNVLLHYLRIFCNIAGTCGDVFIEEMTVIISTLHDYYALFTRYQAEAAQQGARGTENYRTVRLLKKHVLLLFERFVQNTEQVDFVATACMPQVFNVVLGDYKDSPPEIRDPGVLDLVTACINKLGSHLNDDCKAIIDHTFTPSVAQVLAPDGDPELRVSLFRLLSALNAHCFDAFVLAVAADVTLLDCMLWGARQYDYPSMSTALQMLDLFLDQVKDSPHAEGFFTLYELKILQDVIVCTLDKLHMAGFEMQCAILMHLFTVSAMVPAETPQLGYQAVLNFLTQILTTIPALAQNPTVITTFVDNCYQKVGEIQAFRAVVADFLIEARIWGAEQEGQLEESFRNVTL